MSDFFSTETSLLSGQSGRSTGRQDHAEAGGRGLRSWKAPDFQWKKKAGENQLIGLSQCLQGFSSSQVVQDFFHHQ